MLYRSSRRIQSNQIRRIFSPTISDRVRGTISLPVEQWESRSGFTTCETAAAGRELSYMRNGPALALKLIKGERCCVAGLFETNATGRTSLRNARSCFQIFI